jgi:ubiquinone/menaquinone biosynthesis C-methylase UbiE
MKARIVSRVFFQGPLGSLHAREMARGNREAEEEAVADLAPADSDRVLVIGFGPGVGIRILSKRVTSGHIVGVDPSGTMVKHATRRNRAAIADGRVELIRAAADDLPLDDASVDGVICVNTIQLWDPFEKTVAEVARVLRPQKRFVSFTHDWAIERFSGTDIDEWARRTTAEFEKNGLTDPRMWPGRAEDGKIVAFAARREV